MMSGSYISGTGRRQLLLLPDMIENYIEEDNPDRFMDSFVDSMDLGEIWIQIRNTERWCRKAIL